MINKSFLILVVAVVSLASAQAEGSRLGRIHKERIRSQDPITTATSAPEDHSDEEHVAQNAKVSVITKLDEVKDDNDRVIGSMDTLAALARVQRDQAETFRAWSSQFHVFKTNVMKFMETTSEVLQKNDKKIKTLQRVVRKIANDIDE